MRKISFLKASLFVFPTILLLAGIALSIYRFTNVLPKYEAMTSIIIIDGFCLFGFIISMIVVKKLGGIASVMGKGFFYLGLAFIAQAVAIISSYLFFSGVSYTIVGTVILGGMNLFWGISTYHFFITTGINEQERRNWKTFIITSIITCMSMAIYGNIETVPLSSEVFNAAIFSVNALLIIEIGMLFLNSNRFKGAALSLPVLLLCLGIIFQLVADLFSRNIIKLGSNNLVIDDIFYNLSWFLLSLSPTVLLMSKVTNDETRENYKQILSV